MNHPYVKTYTALFSIILSVMLVLGFLSYRNNITYKETSKQVINSHQVLFQAEHLLSFIKDMTVSRRGYFLTHDSIFVPNFLDSKGIILMYVDSLDHLTKNNFGQQLTISRLKKVIAQRSELSLRIANLSKNTVQNRYLIQGATFKAAELINSMEKIIIEIQKEENRLLKIRDNFYYNTANSLNNRFLAFLCGAALFVIGVYFIMKNDLKYRNETEKRIGKLNESLEQRVKEKTREVIEKETRYHWILDNMMEGIQILDFNWKYVYANEAWSKECEIPIDTLLGTTMMDHYPAVQNNGLFILLQECANNGTPKRLEYDIIFPSGNTGFYSLSIQPMPEGILILSKDISERKKRELEKEKYIKELEKVLFKISHEVRHPIVQILGVSDLLEQKLISEDELHVIMSAMRKSALLLDSHTRDLTEFVHTIKSDTEPEPTEI